MRSNVLNHYGILGMKWGIRRTPAQLGRSAKKGGKAWSPEAKEAKKLKKKGVKQLSNTELRKLNEREQLESTYSRMNPSKYKKAISYVAAATTALGTAVTLYNNASKSIAIGKKFSDKLGTKIMKSMISGVPTLGELDIAEVVDKSLKF